MFSEPSPGPFCRLGWLVGQNRDVSDYAEPPPRLVAKLRKICLALPDAYEEHAWVGTRWMVRKRTFAHVLEVVEGTPRSYALASGAAGPVSIVTFRAQGLELEALRNAGRPFFVAQWGRDVVGRVLNGDVDWDEMRELLTESYCVMAPQKLVALVERPPEQD